MTTLETTPLPARAVEPPAVSSTPATPTFMDLGVPRPIARSLAHAGLTSAFPIQAATLPDSLAGRDIIGRGRTGSGKTIAFCIPTVAALARSIDERRQRSPRGLILVPTRELAAQVAQTLVPMAQSMKLHVVVVHGGVGAGPQINGLRRADVVIATPGRLEDLIAQGHCRLNRVEVTVLDEADHLADLGFLPAVRRLLEQTPAGGQRLLFSATLDNGIDALVDRFLQSPVMHSVDPAESPVPEIEHHFLEVDPTDKQAVVRELAGGSGRRLLFTRTKHGAKKLTQQLAKSGIRSVEMHGNLSQSVRTRNLDDFASGRAPVLVATDIAARGLHVDAIELVVHVDPPAEHKAFLHRSGRTARAGAAGTVITIVTPAQRRDVDALARRAGITPKRTKVVAGDPLLAELRGAAAEPYVAPVARPVAEPAPGTRTDQRSRSKSSHRSRNAGSAAGNARLGGRGAPHANHSQRRNRRRPRSGA